jgi:uncharacterized protein
VAKNIGVVQNFYEALGAGDVPRALGLLSTHLEWTEAEGFPYYSGTWHEPQMVVDKLLIPIMRDWEGFSITAHEFIADGEKVVSFGKYSGTFRATGRTMVAPFAHRWVVQDGKIVRFDMYTDTLKIQEAMKAA